jgi:DNA-binding SARP family transcriptional activator/tetratricopeptide (TPR) repeat protein/energy-coupling factor transporter ATP-binding protein EcfA2
VEFRILGPLEFTHDARCIPLAAARERIIMAMLLLEAGHVLPIDRLIEGVWGDEPPTTARGQIQNCVSTLRRRIVAVEGRDLILTRPPGYLLQLDGSTLDLHLFEQRAAEGRALAAAGDASGAARRLRGALALWRGAALADVDSRLVHLGVTRLNERRIAVYGECLDSELAAGADLELVGELVELVEAHPLHERFKALLMKALYRGGRQAEALEVYRHARQVLLDELGVEPGEELQRLHRAILTGELDGGTASGDATSGGATGAAAKDGVAGPGASPEIEPGTGGATPTDGPTTGGTSTSGTATGAASDPVSPPPWSATAAADPGGTPAAARTRAPSLLPADIPDFTGREEIVERFLAAARTAGDAGGGRAVHVSVVVGQGGSGKSTLAVHVAHLLTPHYPDGRLFARLRSGDRTVGPSDILERFLRALGVSGAALPDGLEARAELFRDLIAGRRVLIVLDDAMTEQQVAALLPGTAESAVIVTSRRRLTGLPAAARYEIGPMARRSAVELLGRVAGTERVAAEPENADRLCGLCGDLPLALRIAAARLAARPHWSVGELVDRLDDESRRLDELHHDGLQMRASISLTYEHLSDDARVLFRRLALLDAPGFASWVGAPLLDADVRRAQDALESLTESYLVHADPGPYPGQVRYRFHDITRPYARELLADDSAHTRRAAIDRLVAAMAGLACEAHRRDHHAPVPGHADAPARTALPDTLVHRLLEDPLAWLEQERAGVLAAVRQSAALGMAQHCRDLALGSVALFEAHMYVDDWRETHETALEAARRAGDTAGEAALVFSLGRLATLQHRAGLAARRYQAAEALFADLGGRDAERGRTQVRAAQARLDYERGDLRRAMAGWHESLDALRDRGDRTAEALVLDGLAQAYLDLDDVATAQDLVDQAAWICEEAGDRRIGARVRLRAADLLSRRGRFDAADEACRIALAASRARGHRVGECYAQLGLGQVAWRRGDPEGAIRALANARALSVATGEPLAAGRVALDLARIALESGEPPAAAQHADRALERFGELGAALWRARALAVRGQIHGAAREPERALALWRQARALLGELRLDGLVPLDERLRQDVAALEQGGGPAGPARAGIGLPV